MNGNQQPNDTVYKPDQQPDYTALQALLEAFQELISWTRQDSKNNSFSIVYPDWTIYNTVHACYSDYRLRHLLGAHGINIIVCDHEQDQPVYQIDYHTGGQ